MLPRASASLGSCDKSRSASMAKADTTKVRKPRAPREVELEPDAWPRFEQFIRDIAKDGPQHRVTKPKAKSSQSLGHIAKKKAPPSPLSGRLLIGAGFVNDSCFGSFSSF